MRRRQLLIVAVTLAAALPSAWASSGPTIRDRFESVSFSGNDGTADWSGEWVEGGESNGPTKGRVRVSADAWCDDPYCLEIETHHGDSYSASRSADLSGTAEAELRFDLRRNVLAPGNGGITVQVRAGGDWSPLWTYAFVVDDPEPIEARFDITPWIAADTAVRFLVWSTDEQGVTTNRVYIDDVEIRTELGEPPITPPPPPSTTSTTVPTTTPGSTTTTTTTLAATTSTTSPATTTVPAADSTPATTATTTTVPLTPVEAAEVALRQVTVDLGADLVAPPTDLPAAERLTPDPDLIERPGVQNLVANFATAVEDATGSLIPSIVLAAFVAWLSVRGLEASDRRKP